MTDLFAGLISSKTRINLIVRFFFNPGTKAYLRELATDFGVSTNAVREELNQLTKTGLLTSKRTDAVSITWQTATPSFPGIEIDGQQGHGFGSSH
jgi:DNA-binding FadR family transcriptional regulator